MTSGSAPRVSVFTPTHRPTFLDEAYESMVAQTFEDWEWVIVLNGGTRWRPPRPDDRIRLVVDDSLTGVGAAKARACSECTGDLLVELDHDDVLVPECLAKVVQAFDENPDAVFVYSDAARMLADRSRDETLYGPEHGWTTSDIEFDGTSYVWTHSLPPTPHNVGLIWYAPNHVRAFRAETYREIGGYDSTLTVLDDQDIMCRLYQKGRFVHIPEMLYLQRMHDKNTQIDATLNQQIQEQTVLLYDRHIQDNALAWAAREGLLALDMGAAHNRPDGYLGVDQYERPNVDIVATLPDRLPLEDNSVGVIRAVDFLEHVADKIGLINELYRVLAPGGILLSFTPSTDGRGAFQDPTHVAFYNENSFWYYTKENIRAFVPQIEAAFQASRIITHFPTEWHQANNIVYVTANLIALKPGTPRNGGLIEFSEYS